MVPLTAQTLDEFDPMAVQREAAMFYGLFLRGHSAEKLRQDIDIPHTMIQKWLTRKQYDAEFKNNVKRVYHFRRQVLAVFDELVDQERTKARLQ